MKHGGWFVETSRIRILRERASLKFLACVFKVTLKDGPCGDHTSSSLVLFSGPSFIQAVLRVETEPRTQEGLMGGSGWVEMERM